MHIPSSADPTVGDLIIEAFGRYPTRDAFVLGDRRVTYAEAADTTGRIMAVLAAHGIGKGSAVAALSPNTPEVWLLQAASYLLGATYTGLHPLGSADDHVTLCEDAGITLLVVHPEFAATAAKITAGSANVAHLLSLGPAEVGRDLLAMAAAAPARPLDRGPAGPEDTAWLQYTGGTTGRPKGVEVPHRALVAQTAMLTVSWGLPENPRYLIPAPITHAGVLPVLPTLCKGGTVVLHQGFDPEHWLRTVAEERITYTFAVPTMLYALLDHGAGDADLSSLETLLYGSAPMMPARIAEAYEAFGAVIMQGYGQTECLGMATSLRKDEHADPALLASCGRPVSATRVDILDDGNQPVADGEVGELCVRSAAVMTGYRNQPEQTADALAGGWLHTGDLAMRDDRGFFHLVDRKKDIVVSGAFNVYPREIEDVIAEAAGVSAVAVIGVPDDRWGEAVTAYVSPRPGAKIDTAPLTRLVRERKGAHQTPKAIHVVDDLPRTPAGKIDKKVLRSRHWADGGRQVH
ncbi:AMP-binding protein [Pseudonocardia endophytica]|uniref:Fatty-acyl-CoA synthase n=1 Tax=Pseudonocardia endophytica TaxID=401976 RepID=A0A4R1HZM1_PSEEN|nr:AMP-binding protein [Pseudonocardia endophytica]TCK26360.1 fatty-acyl-CoA synthase [Pseudonocardia endophytica]